MVETARIDAPPAIDQLVDETAMPIA